MQIFWGKILKKDLGLEKNEKEKKTNAFVQGVRLEILRKKIVEKLFLSKSLMFLVK